MEKKKEFSIKYNSLEKKISKQKDGVENHHIKSVLKQNISDKKLEMSELSHDLSSSNGVKINKINFKQDENSEKDLNKSNRKHMLNYDQIEEIRKQTNLITRKNIEKIDLEFKEKSQKLLLPLIKK